MSLVDDELSPRPVTMTAHEATAARKKSEDICGISLPVSLYERGLYEAEGLDPPVETH